MTHTPNQIIGYLKSVAIVNGHDTPKGSLCRDAAELIEKLLQENETLRQNIGTTP